MMLTSKQLRRTKLVSIAASWKEDGHRLSALAQRLDMSPSYLGQLLNGKRQIGDSTARKLEQRLGWERGSLDNDQDTRSNAPIDLRERLRYARKAAGLTQQQIADECGIKREAVAQWESTDSAFRTVPTLRNAKRFSALTGVSIDWLVRYWPEDSAA